MKFIDYEYVRPNLDEFKNNFFILLHEFDNASTFNEQDSIMKKINDLRNFYLTNYTLVFVRHSIDTYNEFYDKENEFFDENNPIYEGLISKFYKSLIQSKFRNQLEDKWGKHLFTIADISVKTFSDEIVEDLQKENKLNSQYNKLKASAKIFFDGEERNLSQMTPFIQSKDRETRKSAQLAVKKYYEENESEFDRIYDELVKTRHTIAKKLGYKNFIELGYYRMGRSDYDALMVANYRKQVLEDLVPLAQELLKRQAKRLGVESLKYYDEELQYLSGNATPKGEESWMIDNAKKMYKELSKETDEFFTYMVDNGLLDLVAKKGKRTGGYCTYINNYKSPFIFSNFNGTSHDVDVLTHEAGHAFQVYSSRNFEVPEYNWPTSEAAEIHSMSMEFFAWPWMNLFFKEDELKYKFSHLSDAILFIPYGVTVDEFQHFVYENPNITPKERKTKWREIEQKYLPHRDYEDNDFLNNGGFWFRQSHIFTMPFYYIDYTLAQVCALQYWVLSRINKEEAWNSYLRLCRAGGSKSFLGLIEIANLKNPFHDGCIKSIIEPVKEWLNNIDDTKL